MPEKLTLAIVQEAVSGSAAAFRSITKLQPVGGEGDKLFPATYVDNNQKPTYAWEKRRLTNGELVDCVLINSVQSEANHGELALKDGIERSEFWLPLIEVGLLGETKNFRKPLGNLTSLEVPHRLADAILRDSELPDGTRFQFSEYAKRWSRATVWNATPIYEICPTGLVFGMWGSPNKAGGLGAKFERAFVSEVIAVDAIRPAKRYGFRIDPIETSKKILVTPKSDGFAITNEKQGIPPSKINHGNIIFPEGDAGIRCRYAEQTTVISLGALRKLLFPVDGQQDSKRDAAARTVLALIGLTAAVLASERGTSLRSRCHLWPVEERVWELLDKPGQEVKQFTVTGTEASAILKEAVEKAESAGLVWMKEKLMLRPTAELLELIRQSQEVAAAEPAEGSAG